MNRDKLNDLKKELPYQWRVQSINDFGAVCVAYIDSRDVQNLLDDTIGAENWQSDYKEIKGNLFAGIAINCGNEWVWKWDCGVESKTEAEKGEASDSFKRAAVKWGIGRFLYSLEIKRLKVTDHKGKKYPLDETTGKAIFDGQSLTDYINSLGTKKTKVSDVKTETPPTDGELQDLRLLVYSSDLTSDEREQAMTMIDNCSDWKVFQKIQYRLESRQTGYDQVANPSQKDINKKVRQITGA